MFICGFIWGKKKKCRIMALLNYFLFALVVQLILCMIIDFLNHSSNLAYDRYLASALSLCDIQNCHIMICTISVEDNTKVLLKMKRMLLVQGLQSKSNRVLCWVDTWYLSKKYFSLYYNVKLSGGDLLRDKL